MPPCAAMLCARRRPRPRAPRQSRSNDDDFELSFVRRVDEFQIELVTVPFLGERTGGNVGVQRGQAIPSGKLQIPNPKSQISSKFQVSKLTTPSVRPWSQWNLGAWNLFGIWNLEFGVWKPGSGSRAGVSNSFWPEFGVWCFTSFL